MYRRQHQTAGSAIVPQRSGVKRGFVLYLWVSLLVSADRVYGEGVMELGEG